MLSVAFENGSPIPQKKEDHKRVKNSNKEEATMAHPPSARGDPRETKKGRVVSSKNMEVVQGAINVLIHTLLPNTKREKAKVKVEALVGRDPHPEIKDVVVQLRLQVTGKATVLFT